MSFLSSEEASLKSFSVEMGLKETKLKTIQTDITSIYKQVKMLNPEMLQGSNTGKVKPDSGRMQRKRKNEGKGEIQDACKQMRVTRSRRVQISA